MRQFKFNSDVSLLYERELRSLQARMIREGVSQYHLASRLHLDPANLSRYLSGVVMMPYMVKLALDDMLDRIQFERQEAFFNSKRDAVAMKVEKVQSRQGAPLARSRSEAEHALPERSLNELRVADSRLA